MSKWFKTTDGAVYGKCGLTFGAEATEVDGDTLAVDTGRGILGDRLLADPRLICVDLPAGETGDSSNEGEPIPLSEAGITDEVIVDALTNHDPPIATVEDLERWMADHKLTEIAGIGDGRAKMIRECVEAYRASTSD